MQCWSVARTPCIVDTIAAHTFLSVILDIEKVYFKRRRARGCIASLPVRTEGSIKGPAHSVLQNKLCFTVFPILQTILIIFSPAREIVAHLHISISTTMRFIAVFNLPVILLALVVGTAAAPSGAEPASKSGLSPFAPVTLFSLFNSTIVVRPKVKTGEKPHHHKGS